MTDRTPAYAPALAALHWLMAALVFAAFALGLTVDLFARVRRPAVVNLHALLGLALLLLLPARLWLRLTRRAPPWPEDFGLATRAMAVAGHALLYLLLALAPLAGLRAHFLRGKSLDFGLFRLPSPLEPSRDLALQSLAFHRLFAYALVALALVHGLAALAHHLVLRDKLLARMRLR